MAEPEKNEINISRGRRRIFTRGGTPFLLLRGRTEWLRFSAYLRHKRAAVAQSAIRHSNLSPLHGSCRRPIRMKGCLAKVVTTRQRRGCADTRGKIGLMPC